MTNRTLQGLIARLPADVNVIGDYYPIPSALGIESQTIHDCYWGALRAMLLDEEVISDVEMRHSSAMTVPFLLTGDENDVAFAKAILSELDIYELFEQCLHAVEYGWQPVEIHWDIIDGVLTPTGSERRHPWGFVFGHDGSLINNAYSYQQTIIPKAKVIPVVRKGSAEKPYGESILEQLWPIWQSKWINWANIERLGEKYAIPSVVAFVDGSANADSLQVIADALAPLENGDSVAITAKGIESLDAKGSAAELLKVIEYIDNKINKRITGQTLMNSTQQNGSRALGEVHERASLRLSLGDAKMVFNTLNKTLLKWIFVLNKRPGKVKLEIDTERFKEMYLTSSDTTGTTGGDTPTLLSATPESEGVSYLCL